MLRQNFFVTHTSQYDLVPFAELSKLVECPQFVPLFKWKRESRSEKKDLHGGVDSGGKDCESSMTKRIIFLCKTLIFLNPVKWFKVFLQRAHLR